MGHGAIRLTTSRYYTPSGGSIQGTGITPDIVVEQARIETLDAPERRSEADLRGSLDNDGIEVEDSSEDGEDGAEAAPEEEVDYQLARAIDLLRGIALYRTQTLN